MILSGYGKTGSKNHATCLATLLQNGLNSSLRTADAFPVVASPPSEKQHAIFRGEVKRRPEMRLLFAGQLNSDFARITTHIKPVLQQIRLLKVFNVSYKTRNIAFQLVLQQCYKTSCTFFVSRFTEALVVSLIMLLKKCLFAKRRILFSSFFLVLYRLIDGSDSLFVVTFFSIHFNFHCRARHLVRCCQILG